MCRIPQRSFCIMDLNMTKIKRPLMLHILLHLGIYVTRNLIYFCCCIYVLGRYGIQIYLVKIAISFTKAIIMYSVFEIHTLLHQVNLLTRIWWGIKQRVSSNTYIHKYIYWAKSSLPTWCQADLSNNDNVVHT